MQKGIEDAAVIIEYPTLKQREAVSALQAEDLIRIAQWEEEVKAIIASPSCPVVIPAGRSGGRAKICKQCSYFDFCYSTESE